MEEVWKAETLVAIGSSIPPYLPYRKIRMYTRARARVRVRGRMREGKGMERMEGMEDALSMRV